MCALIPTSIVCSKLEEEAETYPQSRPATCQEPSSHIDVLLSTLLLRHKKKFTEVLEFLRHRHVGAVLKNKKKSIGC